jgi:hypothetical protein
LSRLHPLLLLLHPLMSLLHPLMSLLHLLAPKPAIAATDSPISVLFC